MKGNYFFRSAFPFDADAETWSNIWKNLHHTDACKNVACFWVNNEAKWFFFSCPSQHSCTSWLCTLTPFQKREKRQKGRYKLINETPIVLFPIVSKCEIKNYKEMKTNNTTIPRLWDPGFGWFPLSPILAVGMSPRPCLLKFQNNCVTHKKIRNLERKWQDSSSGYEIGPLALSEECWNDWTKLEITKLMRRVVR